MVLASAILCSIVMLQAGEDAGAFADAGELADSSALVNAGDAGSEAVVDADEDAGSPDAGARSSDAWVSRPAHRVPVLQIISTADGGTAFSEPASPERRIIPLRPGRYRLTLGDGPPAEFDLIEGQEVTVEATNFVIKGAWPVGEEIPFFDELPTLRTVKARRQLEGRLAVGQANSALTRPTATGTFGVLLGLTDRLQLNAPTPYFSYLLGEPGVREWVLEGGIPMFSIGAPGAVLFLSASAGYRSYWRPERSWLAGVEITSGAAFGAARNLPRTFGYNSLRGALGYSVTVKRRFTFNLGAALNGSYMRPGPGGLIITAREPFRSVPAFQLGSVLRIAGRDLPLVQWHVGRRLSIDLYSTVALGYYVPQVPLAEPPPSFPLYGDFMIGFSYVGG